MTPDMNLDKPMIGSGPVGQLSDTEQPETLGVMMKPGAHGHIGPVGRDVLLTGRLEMVARPDPVGPHGKTGTVCLSQIRCRPGGAHSHSQSAPWC